MLATEAVVNLSRFQFALTAMFHFLFVPLTLGLSIMLAVMETVYVMTNKPIWRDMTKFWGALFGINFAMGVATGLTMEFQFGTNWAYYSHYVGDIFGAPLAIEGLVAFFLEATFVGLFFFGWDKLSQVQHAMVTWLVALGTNMSALWILIANGWMQHPVGSHFDYQTMRMEVDNFYKVIFNPVAQAKFVHTVSAGYVTAAVFVLAISAYYLLRGRHLEFAKRSMVTACAFGLASSLSVVVLGDESGYVANENQKMKLAAIEAMWETEPAPAAFTVFGFPDIEQQKTHYALHVPYLLGLIATRSFNTPVEGINQIVAHNKQRIKRGAKAYAILQHLQQNPDNNVAKKLFDHYKADLGFGLLLKKYRSDVANATDAEIEKAAWDTVPKSIAALFWGFRFMVGFGLFFIWLFSYGLYILVKKDFDHPLYLRIAFYALPLPWITCLLGWFVAEYGRQPWAIESVLPTFLGVSNVPQHYVWLSLAMFTVFYITLTTVEIFLLRKTILLGPDGYFEKEKLPR